MPWQRSRGTSTAVWLNVTPQITRHFPIIAPAPKTLQDTIHSYRNTGTGEGGNDQNRGATVLHALSHMACLRLSPNELTSDQGPQSCKLQVHRAHEGTPPHVYLYAHTVVHAMHH